MSILTAPLTAEIEVGGKHYPIRTDFRVWLKFDGILKDKNLGAKRFEKIFLLCFDPKTCPVLPHSAEATVSALCEFYAGGKKSGKKTTKSERVLDYEEDAARIYASFYEQYGIDLVRENMHWHLFLALFESLKPDTSIMKAISYRCTNLDEIKDEKRRAFYRKMKRLYALSDTKSDAEKEGALAEALSGLM